MPELLLEVGCEEIPASFVRKAYQDLLRNVQSGLKDAGIEFGQGVCMGTPRRLIVSIQDVAARQPDVTKDVRGPSAQAAYDAEGNPSKALEGFCRGQGVDPTEARTEGDYVWVTKKIEGRDTAEVLQELLPQAIRSLTFDKAMRWASFKFRFARPLRWMLAAYDDQNVPFEVEGVQSGVRSRGHRFNNPEEFEATTISTLVETLRAKQVEPDPAEREKRVRESAKAVCSAQPELTDSLVDENVFLTEWPSAVEGTFKEEYLELPEPVLITAMAKHERFFPVRDPIGGLTNKFVSIRNGGVDEVVREGNAWVLNARFNDASFFYEEDKKKSLTDFLEDTRGIVFSEKLGTVRDRADRLERLAEAVATNTREPDLSDEEHRQEIEYAKTAARLAKADLATGLVSELTSLQGVIGGVYARREGLPEPVAFALASQYDLGGIREVDSPAARTALRLIIADQLDKLMGYLGLSLAPSGSSDPYGLRKAATILIEASWLWRSITSYGTLLVLAYDGYERQGVELDGEAAYVAFHDIFRGRYEALLPDVPHDILESATHNRALARPRDVRFSMQVMERLSTDVKFVQTATRPLNIVTAARAKDIPMRLLLPEEDLDSAALQSPEADVLWSTVNDVYPDARRAAYTEDAERLIVTLKRLEQPINTFFDSTMVMVEDETVRAARLELLHACGEVLLLAGDFTKIVIEG